MKSAALLFAALTLLAGCHKSEADPASGLVPEEPVVPKPVASSIDPDSVLAQMRSGIRDVPRGLPPLTIPPPPPKQPTGYNPWNDERVDATTFDTLTASINHIITRMPEEQGRAFDQSVKYLLFQVPSSPFVSKKAGGGGTPSDADILKAAQELVHGKTPFEIGQEAWNKANQAQANISRVTAPDTYDQLSVPNPMQATNPLE